MHDDQLPNNQIINKEINKRARTETSNLNSGVQRKAGTNWESTVYSYAFHKKTVKIILVHSRSNIQIKLKKRTKQNKKMRLKKKSSESVKFRNKIKEKN